MIVKKNISEIFFLFLFVHLVLWTLIPTFSNINLPLDTIEALAWGSNLDWGYSKHPPFSAFSVEFFYFVFGSQDWAFYFLSQIFVLLGFIFVWKLANEIFDNKIYSIISILVLEGIYFYNFTTPEFNVNVSQIPFWALTAYFFWQGISNNKKKDWILFGIFSALGFLSKYLFIYILISFFLFLIINLKKNKKFLKNYFFSIIVSFLILTPHFIWLYENSFETIFYGLDRSNLIEKELINHLTNPLIFIFKQFLILIPFFLMIAVLLKKTNFRINLKNKKVLYICSISILPVILIFITSFLTGAKIRTMWMTPFYLFFGLFLVYYFRKVINPNKIKNFLITFSILFFLSPLLYLFISVSENNKRTDYPGKEIAYLVQDRWDKNFINEITIVVGDEWSGGNLSYHLKSRPKWFNNLDKNLKDIDKDAGFIYIGNPTILKKICPGLYGTIKPIGICMLGKK